MQGSSNTSVSPEVLDLDFWENECPLDCAFKCLQTVKMTDISGLPHEMRFIKFLLENSPILEIMSITPSVYAIEGRMHMVTELLEFRRVSPQAKIKFVLDWADTISCNIFPFAICLSSIFCVRRRVWAACS